MNEPSKSLLSRRRLLAGAGATAASLPALHSVVPHAGLHGDARAAAGPNEGGHDENRGHGNDSRGIAVHNPVGRVDPKVNGFDPSDLLRDFDYGVTRRTASGQVIREWEIVAEDKRIEVAPGVKFDAWTYNGRVPGPSLRAREGERLRVRFVNGSKHPHTMHFHGIHLDIHDGVPAVGPGNIEPGGSWTYEFDAAPFGFHHYHCHTTPLASHIHKGLYGVFIVDPKKGRADADELVMVQNGFDTNFDLANEVYAVNTVAFHYVSAPVRVKRGELIRIYLLNILEFDLANSFHIHGNFFDRYPTGTQLEPLDYTDVLVQGQGQRDILEVRFPYTGKYMFHAHASEFAELGWMGFFDVVD